MSCTRYHMFQCLKCIKYSVFVGEGMDLKFHVSDLLQKNKQKKTGCSNHFRTVVECSLTFSVASWRGIPQRKASWRLERRTAKLVFWMCCRLGRLWQ